MGDRTVNILGVPTSAGAYCVGVEQAPPLSGTPDPSKP